MAERNAHLPPALRAIVNGFSPSVPGPMREAECVLCHGSKYNPDGSICRHCNARGYYLTDGVDRETK